MGYIKIWVHLVWTTKNREPLLTTDIRQQVFDHILENAIDKGIYIDFINGFQGGALSGKSLNGRMNILLYL